MKQLGSLLKPSWRKSSASVCNAGGRFVPLSVGGHRAQRSATRTFATVNLASSASATDRRCMASATATSSSPRAPCSWTSAHQSWRARPLQGTRRSRRRRIVSLPPLDQSGGWTVKQGDQLRSSAPRRRWQIAKPEPRHQPRL